MKLPYYQSLRRRYTSVAVLLTLFVIFGAIWVHINVENARDETTHSMEARNELLPLSRLIRDSVWLARDSLEAFLLNPQQAKNQQRMEDSLQRSIQYTNDLFNHPWIILHDQKVTVNKLKHAILELQKASGILVETRLDGIMQYPSLSVARQYMLPNNQKFMTAVSLALDEIISNQNDFHLSEAYRAFVQARHYWSVIISTFRMYLANRLTSFDVNALQTQEQDIELLFAQLDQQIYILSSLNSKELLGIVASDAVDQIATASSEWYQTLLEVEQIHRSNKWRTDANLMENKVSPLLDEVWLMLLTIDMGIEISTDQDVHALNNVTQLHTKLIWGMTIVILLVIAIGFITLERSILKPIATVASALRAEAYNSQDVTLPEVTTTETQHLVDAFSEMRKQIRERQVELEFQALHDALTGLPNRTLLLDRVQQAIRMAHRDNKPLALLMMDLDRFKEVNDTLGHQIGDRLLQDVSLRFMGSLRETDTVARLGGDEFAILLPNFGKRSALHVARKVLNALEPAFNFDGQLLYIGASIGIAMYPTHGKDAQALIQKADVAMYVAKRNKTGLAFYDPKDDRHSVSRLSLFSDLRQALASNDLDLHYMPKIELKTGRVSGVEALLRWQHAERGDIPPIQFIPLAEQTGLIKQLAYWVLNKALHQCSIWRANGLDLDVAVNLSVYNLADPEYIEQIQERLQYYNLPKRCLVLEITESAMMADPERAVRTLSRLHNMGVQLAVDDFGTGFSSLAYLKQLPVGEIKIDKSFVMDMIEDENDAIIVRSTIDLAHNLGLKVVAEGVKSQAIHDTLKKLNCDSIQGFFTSPPLSVAEMDQWISLYPSDQIKNKKISVNI